MELTRAEYQVDNGIPVIWLFSRNEHGERSIYKVKDFVPYFYVPVDERNNLRGIRQDKKNYTAIDGSEVVKVYVSVPEDVPMIRDKYSRTYEADIPFPVRYMIDEIDSIEPTRPKVAFLDIETDNTGSVPDPMKPSEAIICVTIYLNLDDIYYTFVWREDLAEGVSHRIFDERLQEVRWFRTEEAMLNGLADFIAKEQPDIVTGWNSSRFDLPYLVNRFYALRINPNRMSPMNSVYMRKSIIGEEAIIKGIGLLDMYDAHRRFSQGQEESYRLGDISQKILGQKKIDITANNIRWHWKFDLDRLIEYNATDCKLIRMLDEKLQLIGFVDELRRVAFCHLEEALVASKVCDCYLLRMFHGRTIFPTKTKHEKESYEGAIVGSWATGIHENVVIYDIAALYPSIMWSLNLSPETIIDDGTSEDGTSGDGTSGSGIITVNGVNISTSKRGLLPQAVDNLFKERAKYKKLMAQEEIDSDKWKVFYNRQYALKQITNSLYGATAYPGSRIFDPRIAKTITHVGREIIMWSKRWLEENLDYSVLYVDTDSLAWSCGDEVNIALIKEILKALNQSYDEFMAQFGVDNHIINMEFEKVYSRAFFGKAKKRYAGHISWQDDQWVDRMVTVGFETRRSDSSQFTKSLQMAVFRMLLRDNEAEDVVLGYIRGEIERVRDGKYSWDEIGIPKGMTKDPFDYGSVVYNPDGTITQRGVTANVRAAQYSIKNLQLDLSSKPKMVYVKAVPGYPDTDVVAFDEDRQVPPGTEIDLEKMLDKTVKLKLGPIFEALGWHMSDVCPWWRNKKMTKKERMKNQMALPLRD